METQLTFLRAVIPRSAASMYGAFVQIKRCSAQQARQKKDSRSSGHGLEEKCGLDELPLVPAWPGGLVQDTA